ncbi:hypothetical protein [Clostridium sp. BJN0013]|uniref:hypothetical protein n=1 Tax=Clostridium sp. BJN0013 TaxID=3236840 RepID=UPI0034C63FF8
MNKLVIVKKHLKILIKFLRTMKKDTEILNKCIIIGSLVSIVLLILSNLVFSTVFKIL